MNVSMNGSTRSEASRVLLFDDKEPTRGHFSSSSLPYLSHCMAQSKYEYVKKFERDEVLLPNTWTVIRLDGRGFHQCVSMGVVRGGW